MKDIYILPQFDSAGSGSYYASSEGYITSVIVGSATGAVTGTITSGVTASVVGTIIADAIPGPVVPG